MVLVYIDYNMLFSYSYCWWQNWQWRTNAPRPPAISTATEVHRSNTDDIAQCGMSTATPEATGRRHWATACTVLPQCPPRQQSTNNNQQIHHQSWPFWWPLQCSGTIPRASSNQWKRSRASLDATGCHHWASTCSDTHQLDMPTPVFLMFFIVKSSKKATNTRSTRIAPNNNRGMTYQTDEAHLTSLTEYFVGGGGG